MLALCVQTNKGTIEFDAQTPIEVKGKEGKVVTYVPKRVAKERAKVSGFRPTFAPIESRHMPAIVSTSDLIPGAGSRPRARAGTITLLFVIDHRNTRTPPQPGLVRQRCLFGLIACGRSFSKTIACADPQRSACCRSGRWSGGTRSASRSGACFSASRPTRTRSSSRHHQRW